MTHNTKILKLSSGEEIICNVAQSSENNHISVMQPMKLNAYPNNQKRFRRVIVSSEMDSLFRI